jgi:2-oxoglutarate ferredoxin oxidoreductase subunit gamma
VQEDIIISGFGGQGALFAGQVLAYAGLAEGKQVTWLPSYGPETRGGTAHCTVIVADEEIGAPLVRQPTTAIAMNPPSMDKYEPLVRTGGLLIVNNSLVSARSGRKDIRTLYIAATEVASALGDARLANVVLLGAFLGATGLVSPQAVERALEEHLGERHRDLLAANREALRAGVTFASEQTELARRR